MKPPKSFKAWAIWLDWSKMKGPKPGGAWFKAWEKMPTLFASKRAAEKHMVFPHEQLVRVTVTVQP